MRTQQGVSVGYMYVCYHGHAYALTIIIWSHQRRLRWVTSSVVVKTLACHYFSERPWVHYVTSVRRVGLRGFSAATNVYQTSLGEKNCSVLQFFYFCGMLISHQICYFCTEYGFISFWLVTCGINLTDKNELPALTSVRIQNASLFRHIKTMHVNLPLLSKTGKRIVR